jgi:hypothetical protein
MRTVVINMAPTNVSPQFAIPNLGATLAIGAFLLVGQMSNYAYALLGRATPDLFELTYVLCLAALIVHWVRADKRRLGISRAFEEDALLLFAWPLAFPYYLFSSRGARGAVTLAGFVGLALLAYLLPLPLYLILRYLGEGSP